MCFFLFRWFFLSLLYSSTHSGSDRFTLEELIASRSERRAFNLVLLSDRERNEVPIPGVYHSKISSTGEFLDSNVASSPTLPDRRIPLVSLSSLIENGLIPSSGCVSSIRVHFSHRVPVPLAFPHILLFLYNFPSFLFSRLFYASLSVL